MREQIGLTATNIEEVARKATEILRQGGIILYPTDTLYGLGADVTNKDAVEKIYAIKGRDAKNPVSVIVPHINAAATVVEITPLARRLAATFMPGPLTIVLQKTLSAPLWLNPHQSTIGIRIPNQNLCVSVASQLGRPFTTASANKSGMQPERSVDAILAQLGTEADLIDLIIDAGELPVSLPSTVVDAQEETLVVLREGVILREDIR